VAAEALANPYLGPRPFEREDAQRFFGRTREMRDVVSLVMAQRILLLYSTSGAGKSSLLNAGVLPLLEERGADVLPVASVRSEDRAGRPPNRNVFVLALLSSLGAERRAAIDQSLKTFLRQQPRRPGEGPRVLVIDQFEELFTTHLEQWQRRAGLFSQLRRALKLDPSLRVVLSIREEFVTQLEPFAPLMPGGLRSRFRLEPLDRASSLAAVTNPLIGTSRSFAPGAAEALVNDLLRFLVDTGKGQSKQVEGQYVEPVQLQVACRTLWSDLPEDVTEITTQHLRAYADVDQVLAQFYDAAVAAAARQNRKSERRIRRWVEKTLITPGGTRGFAFVATEDTAGMSNDVVRALEEKRLIRADWRAGARWYELTHDRLIKPIRASNQRYWARRRLQRLAAGLLIAAIAGAIAAGVLLTETRGQTGSYDLEPIGRLAVQEGAHENVSSAAFSPDGSFVVTAGSDGEARVWYWSTRKVEAELMQPGSVTSSVFSNLLGNFVLTAGADGQARIWSWATETVVATLGAGGAQPASLSSAAFSFDNSLVVTAGADGAVRVWDWRARQVRATLMQPAAAESATFCPERVTSCTPGISVVTACADGKARVWNWISTGTEPIVLNGGHGALLSAAFSPDGRLVVTSGADGVVQVWNWRSKRVEAELIQSGRVPSAVFSNLLGKFVLTAGADGAARIWDWASRKSPVVLGDPAVRTQPTQLSSAAFSPVGALVVTAGSDGLARIYGPDQVSG
jgi:WD40 repeat protein